LDPWTPRDLEPTVNIMKMRSLASLAAAAVTIVLLGSPPSTWAQSSSAAAQDQDDKSPSGLFVYVDDRGSLHVVSSLDLVPAPYRGRARPASLESASGIQAMGSSSRARSSSSRSNRTTYRSPSETRNEQPQGETPTEKPASSSSSGVESLRTERAEVLDELGQLEEGWRESGKNGGNGDEPTIEALEQRSDKLARRIEELDRRIQALEQGRKR